MPSFTPKKDEELVTLLKEGEGTFTVLNAIEATSKKGDPMIKLLLECYDCENRKGNIFEYLIFTDNVFCERKIKHFCFAVGLEKEYESGKLNHFECQGRSGNLLIGIQKDKTGAYPDKNCVYDFLKCDGNPKYTNVLHDLNDNLDDINF
jgi:hypothetical protein